MYYNQGLNGERCGWFCRNWRKIGGAVAAIVGGPVGILIGLGIQFIPQKNADLEQFPPHISDALDTWAQSKFNTWYSSKILALKNHNTLTQLTKPSIISEVNKVLEEMGILVKYYQHKASTGIGFQKELYAAKAVVMQDGILEFNDIYVGAINRVGGVIYNGKKVVKTKNLTGTPDVTNWGGRSFSIAVPFYSSTAIVNNPPPGDHPFVDLGADPSQSEITFPPILIDGGGLKPTAHIPKPTRPTEITPVCVQSPCGETTITQKPTTLQAAKPTNPALSNNTTQDDKVSKNVLWKALAILGIGYAIAK